MSGASNLRVQFSAADIKRTGSLRLLLTGESEAAGEVLAALGERLPDPPYIVLACAAGDEKAGAEGLEEPEPPERCPRVQIAGAGWGGMAGKT